MNMKAPGSSETSEPNYYPTRCKSPGHLSLNYIGSESLKKLRLKIISFLMSQKINYFYSAGNILFVKGGVGSWWGEAL
jgi:hypothetical protein